MKKKLYNILPKFITTLKHGDKIAHTLYGTLFYLILLFIVGPHISLFLTWALAVGVEIYDTKTHKGDIVDFLSTIILPTLIYLLTNQ
jgi:hypothetical protein